MPEHLLENHAGVERNVFVLVAFECLKDDIAAFAEIFDCRPSAANLSSEEVIEDVHDIFARFKFESVA